MIKFGTGGWRAIIAGAAERGIRGHEFHFCVPNLGKVLRAAGLEGILEEA